MPFATFPYSVDMDTERWQSWAREAYRYDPKRAKQLLAEAGYPNGFEMKFANMAMAGTPFMVPVGLAVADFWNRIGIKVSYKHYEWGTFAPMVRKEQKQMVGVASIYRTAGRPVAAARYYTAFDSRGTHHLFGYKDDCPELCKKFNALNKAVAVEKNAAKRTELTNQMIELVANSWIAVPIIEGMGYWAVNSEKVGAFKPIPGRHEFGDLFQRMPRPDEKPWQ